MGFTGILGHEFVGVVESINGDDGDGGDVFSHLVGKRVVGEINLGTQLSGGPLRTNRRGGHLLANTVDMRRLKIVASGERVYPAVQPLLSLRPYRAESVNYLSACLLLFNGAEKVF